MSRMVEEAERNDFAAARRIHAELLPLMTVNFIESNPIPVKSAMAALGLLDEVYRLPMVPPRDASRAKIRQVLADLKTDAALAGSSSAASSGTRS
jgi:4-hydroxy-tetrahydrodipicolinate synthase